VAAAISVIFMVEVLEANRVWAGAAASMAAKVSFFSSMISGIASMTRSASLTASARSVQGTMSSDLIFSKWSAGTFPFDTSFSRLALMRPTPRSTNS
jgi:hypothetical protein